MKTILVGFAMWAFGATIQAQQPVNYVPTVTATTSSVSKRTVTTGTVYSGKAQAVRSTGVDVAISFFAAPPEAYDVQCFFLAKDEATKERYIFDIGVQQAQGRFANVSFASVPLTGTTKSWVVIPFAGTFSGTVTDSDPRARGATSTVDGTFSGSSGTASRVQGSKIDGWVVRVVYQGKVLRVDSNQAALSEIAKKDAAVFDKAIKADAK